VEGGREERSSSRAVTHLSTSPTALTPAAMFSFAREGTVFVLIKLQTLFLSFLS
jgi:hypothetical protein